MVDNDRYVDLRRDRSTVHLTTRRRLRSLAAMELLNIPLQVGLWFGFVGLPVTAPNLVGFCLFAVLLLEGSSYWLAKLDQMRGRRRHLPGVRAFRAARAINPLSRTAGLVVTGHAAVADPGRASWPGLAFALFAVIEHVNYFYIQLMHDTVADLRRLRSVGLRPSHLARDIARAARTTGHASGRPGRSPTGS
jgi:hypothetical protein